MKRLNRVILATIAIALFTLGALLEGIVGNLGTNFSQTTWFQSSAWIVLITLSIIGAIIVILQTIHEKRANKPDDNKVTTETKSIGIRIKIADEDISFEVPDAESAIVFLKEFQAGHLGDIAGASIHGENQKQHPETPDVPDTKETEN